MDELEKKMEIKIRRVKAMMVEGFSRVDQKLTAIEELLKKIVQTQNPLEKRDGNVSEKKMGGGVESSENQGDGNMVAIRGGGGGPSHESAPEKPWRAKISRDDDEKDTNDHTSGPQGWLYSGDQGRQGLQWDAGSPHRWVGLYTRHYDKDFGRGKDFCVPAWMGQSELDFRQTDRPLFGRLHEGAGKGQFVNNLVEGGRNQRGSRLDGFGKKEAKTEEAGWVGKKSENDTKKGWSSLGRISAKTGQDEVFKDEEADGWETKESLVGSSDKVADKTDATREEEGEGEEEQTGSLASWGDKLEEEQTGSLASRGEKLDDETDASLQDSLKQSEINGNLVGSMEPNEGRDWSKMIEEKTDSKHGWGVWGEDGPNNPLLQAASEGANEKGHEESQKPGSWGTKEEGLVPKRKHPDSPVEGRNDSLKSSVPLTSTRQRLNIFTTDEQEILNEIEPIMQSIQRIMHQDGYNDGDPLSSDDQTYILDNVFNHHPGKAQKLGAGVDYIMISRYMMNVQGSRCFHVVSTDGRKEDFSYRKCLENFVRAKYPDKADKFILKYFKNSKPRHSWKWERGSGPGEVGAPRSWSGWNPENFKNFEPRRSWKWERGSGSNEAGAPCSWSGWNHEPGQGVQHGVQ